MNKVRVAFIGLGWWANMLADATQKSERIDIVSCCSGSEEKRTSFVNKYRCSSTNNYNDILNDKNIDAVIITTPNTMHATQAISAANSGKHIYVEKPMALDTLDCKKMIEAANTNGVVLMVGHNSRRMARYRKAEELIKNGSVGRIILVEASSTGDLGMRLTPEIWRYYRSESPGGPLTSFTVHCTDNMNNLIGSVKKVSSFINKICGPAETDDVAVAVVEFENGALGYVGGSFITPDRNTFQIHGTKGVLYIDEEGGSVSFQKKGEEVLNRFSLPDADAQRISSLQEEMEEFGRCIQTGEIPEVTGEVGLNAVAVIEAIVKSAKTRSIVEVNKQ